VTRITPPLGAIYLLLANTRHNSPTCIYQIRNV